jgi:hypothetical protein
MAKSRVGGATADVENTAPSIDVTWPGGVASGDFALLMLSWYENSSDTIPTVTGGGWTSLGSSVVIAGGTDVESRVELWYRVCTGSESGTLTVGRASVAFYGTVLLDVYRGDGALSFSSATYGSPGTGTTATAPDVAGSNGQILLVAFGIGDPATASTPTDMSAGQVGTQDTNTGYIFYQFLTADAGAKSSTLGTSRPYLGVSVLVNDAGAGGGARKIILTRPA